MPAQKIRIVLETGELSHGVPLTITGELTLLGDGTIIGGCELVVLGMLEHAAITGTHDAVLEPVAPRRRLVGA